MRKKSLQLLTILYMTGLTISSSYSLLDTFVFRVGGTSGSNILDSSVQPNSTSSQTTSIVPTFTEFGYVDSQINLQINVIRRYETQVYVAVVTTHNHRFIKSAFGYDTYGKNYKEKTSVIANRKNAIFAVNGDYYGFRDIGFVVRNGIAYRITPRPQESDDAIILNDNGVMSTFAEAETSLQTLNQMQPWQVWSFGPVLINDSELVVTPSTKVPNELSSNPRTAIGQISQHQFMFVVSDGRTDESAGLSVYELASIFVEYNATFAYNLDGGGSATMWFNGRIINKPVNSGSTISERSISDIVYVGYEL
ncbi:MAG: phosphodiester glycosidase family protein [Bacilli bacterium]